MSHPYFHVVGYSVTSERVNDGRSLAKASLELEVGGKRTRHSATGVGPVHALEEALRACLASDYPEVESLRLCDYQVSVVDAELGTSARVRVIIQATDGFAKWDAGSVSENVIDASFEALCSATVMGILQTRLERQRTA
ncbi:MAG: 2-isopropylmalate synthase [Actinomycetota bacterium]|jgi:2-isopropylmalate synthase|nr:2-isopropylmalate synthase [Actinomycetota bacterium]